MECKIIWSPFKIMIQDYLKFIHIFKSLALLANYGHITFEVSKLKTGWNILTQEELPYLAKCESIVFLLYNKYIKLCLFYPFYYMFKCSNTLHSLYVLVYVLCGALCLNAFVLLSYSYSEYPLDIGYFPSRYYL